MKSEFPKRWVPKTYKLDVMMTLESKSDHLEDRHKMTESQLAINLHHYCPHIIALNGSDPVTKGDYTKKKVVCIAQVKNAKSSGTAIDIVTKEITNNLDRVYIVRSAKVRVR
jgi:hypothetical protein